MLEASESRRDFKVVVVEMLVRAVVHSHDGQVVHKRKQLFIKSFLL